MELKLHIGLTDEDELRVQTAGAGVLIEALLPAAQIGLELGKDYTLRLRDALNALYPPEEKTASGKRPRRDRKTPEEKLASNIASPSVQKTLEALQRWSSGDWCLVAAISRATEQSDTTVRANLWLLKQAGMVESRPSDAPSPGPQKLTEWRIVR